MIKTYKIEGLSCAACAISSQKILSRIEGVENVRVNYASGKAVVISDDSIALELMNAKLERAGYKLLENNDLSQEQIRNDEKLKFVALRNNLLVSVIFAIPLFIFSMFFHEIIPHRLSSYLMLALSIPIVFYAGRRFFVAAFKQLLVGLSNMDTLVALGTGTAFLYSLFNTIFFDYLLQHQIKPTFYYESAGLIITFILLGRFLEEKAKRGTSRAIESLMELRVSNVSVLIEGIEKKYPIEAILPDDIILIRPGDKIPLDAVIIEGNSEVDESMLSGESLPKSKSISDIVYAATFNVSGFLKVKVIKTYENTVLSNIIKMVEDAQISEAPVQKLVDRISSIFVPSVIVLSFLTGFIWWIFGPEPKFTHALINMVTVLVIACPCALGLATPTAIIAGIGSAAKKGILIKGAESLEAAKNIDIVVFDKTGTLTEGKPKVTNIHWSSEIENNSILRSLSNQSEHPLSKSIFEYLEVNSEQLSVENFKSETGSGVSGSIDTKNYYLGNAKWLIEKNVFISESEQDEIASIQNSAQSLVCFFDDQKLLALISLIDLPKRGSKTVIEMIHKTGKETYMLTGDNHLTALAIGKEIGISNIKSELLPEDKIKFVRELQQAGHKVAMVGDGINDAPALAQSDLGIAMKSGTEIAMESADVILLDNDPMKIVNALMIAEKTIKILNQNLFWAFIYNILAIPIAAGAFYPLFGITFDPMIAGAAMAFSSVSVVFNSLRLLKA